MPDARRKIDLCGYAGISATGEVSLTHKAVAQHTLVRRGGGLSGQGKNLCLSYSSLSLNYEFLFHRK